MQNSMMMFTFSVFNHKYPSWENLIQKSKIVQSEIWHKDYFEYAESNCGVHFICFRLEIPFLGYPFWSNLVQKFKIDSLSWKLIQKLIRIWRIQWECLFSSFQPEVSFFWKFVPHLKIFCWSCNLESRLIRICRIQCWFSFCLYRKYPVEKLFKKQPFSNVLQNRFS